ncbi:MAG TPA: dual specificity protein phosphatase [Ktedonobacteraceae bacterium]|nr:dual specificity protein phosphatase [Ktedonobacteraceae bacterium]
MSSDPTITPPPTERDGTYTQVPVRIADAPGASTNGNVEQIEQTEPPRVHFSALVWFSSGIVRLTYRVWTRVAAHLFPEGSSTEHFALAIHIPLPDKLNMSWATDHLAVGGRVRPMDIRALAHVGVTGVVDTRAEYCDDAQAMAKEHIELLHLPTLDTHPLTVEQLMDGSKWVNEHIKQGGRVLIHCEHGVGRSVLLTCAVLVYDGMHAQDALELVKRKRWQASPNHKQVVRLREFEATLRTAPRT